MTAPTAQPVADPPPAEPLKVLVVDDEESMRFFLQKGLRRHGYTVATADDGEQAVAQWHAERFDLMVLDLRMPGSSGLEVLHRVRSSDPAAVVLLMTAYGSITTAVEAMQLGAADFLQKPFEIDELVLRLERALLHRRTSTENVQLRQLLQQQDGYYGVLGRSPAMQALVRELELLRDSAATVLLTGESGTGKGMVAKALHLASNRAEQPFVALHCAAVPDTLVESVLFGHEAGAFTGAQQQKAGLISKAHRGTLFLDEIGDMSLSAQAKIERFLQEREFLPVGGTKAVKVDVRVVAATNKDLAAAARDGRFRTELLWRLDVVRLLVPPLRDRRDDIRVLVQHHLQRLCAADQAAPKSVTGDAMGALCAYDWPGNVRELENVVERMAVLAGPRQALGAHDLPAEIRGAAAAALDAGDYDAARKRFDEAYFAALLERCHGNITEAAKLAGLSRGHLHRRLRELRGGPAPADGGDEA